MPGAVHHDFHQGVGGVVIIVASCQGAALAPSAAQL
jgi:hypothetical protein